MITREEILKKETCPSELEENLSALLIALNRFREIWGHPMIVTSGFRTPEHNRAIGGAQNSAHLYCQAADIKDTDRKLCDFLKQNEGILEACGLWMEDPLSTLSWLHLQSRPAIHRVFKP